MFSQYRSNAMFSTLRFRLSVFLQLLRVDLHEKWEKIKVLSGNRGSRRFTSIADLFGIICTESNFFMQYNITLIRLTSSQRTSTKKEERKKKTRDDDVSTPLCVNFLRNRLK